MTDKIQELTEKIYNEGVLKAKKDAEQIISDAKREAAAIISAAKKERDSLLESSKTDAEEIRKNSETELRLAARKFTGFLKQEVERLIITQQTSEPVKRALDDAGLIGQVILTLAGKWDSHEEEQPRLDVWLSPEMAGKLNAMFSNRAVSALENKITFRPDETIQGGFTIGPEKGGYYIRFTDQDFENYFREYIREKTRKLLFGSETTSAQDSDRTE